MNISILYMSNVCVCYPSMEKRSLMEMCMVVCKLIQYWKCVVVCCKWFYRILDVYCSFCFLYIFLVCNPSILIFLLLVYFLFEYYLNYVLQNFKQCVVISCFMQWSTYLSQSLFILDYYLFIYYINQVC